MKDFQEYWKALTFAVSKYEPLKRKCSDIPYVVHPLRVAMILKAVGFNEFTNSDLMISALFHDLVEDTNTTLEEIQNEFNAKVALTVKELSKPKQGNKDEWLKNFGTVSKEAKMIKLADRIDNLMDNNNRTREEIISYAEQGRIILETCGDAHPELTRKLKEVIEICIIHYSG
jgi:(p)ppGpp synthase/HD superfamily hydrolase